MGVLLVVGTEKGAFLARSDRARERWSIEGPVFKGWKVTTAMRDARGRYFLGVASRVYGPTIQMSDDLAKWRQAPEGPSYPKRGKRKLNEIWRIHADREVLFAGVDEAGLFQSDDRGEAWKPLKSLNEHRTRDAWLPGAGGLCAHAILTDRDNPKRMWCGISAVGVFRTDNGGKTWRPKNRGVPVTIRDKVHKDIGYCVHALAQDPEAPATIYRQDHRGMYRTRNGGDSWEPLARGLPQEHAYTGVLRGAMAVDGLDPCGVYFGTTTGTIYASRDRGDTWHALPATLPRILCVAAFVD